MSERLLPQQIHKGVLPNGRSRKSHASRPSGLSEPGWKKSVLSEIICLLSGGLTVSVAIVEVVAVIMMAVFHGETIGFRHIELVMDILRALAASSFLGWKSSGRGPTGICGA
jgi:type IV secretory pathway VirB2 component (pilin)